MQLGISSEAALDAPVSELLRACIRRGLASLELVLGTSVAPDDVFDATNMAAEDSVRISGVITDAFLNAGELAELSRMANAPIIVRGNADLPARIAGTRAVVREGGRALAFVSGAPETWLNVIAGTELAFAWHVDETCQDPAAAAERILRERPIRYVRLAGGGPETSAQAEHGIGHFMRILTLAGYDGPVIMTPSSQRYRVVWSAWLGRRGWGCGSKTAPAGPPVPIHR